MNYLDAIYFILVGVCIGMVFERFLTFIIEKKKIKRPALNCGFVKIVSWALIWLLCQFAVLFFLGAFSHMELVW